MGVAGIGEMAVELQERAAVGRLLLDGHALLEDFAVEAVPGARNGAVLLPVDRLADILVTAGLDAPVAELLALVDEGLARGGQKDSSGEALFLRVVAEVGSHTVLVVVRELRGLDHAAGVGILAVVVAALVLGDETVDRAGEIGTAAVVDAVLERAVIGEVEAGRKALVVAADRRGVVVVCLADHEEVALAAVSLIGSVAVVVPGGEEGHVGVRMALVDPHDGVEAETADTHPDPFIRGGGKILEGGGAGAARVRAVIEVRHRAVEAAEIVGDRAAEDDVIGGIALDKGHRRAEADLGLVGRGAPLVVAPFGDMVLDEDTPVIADLQRDFEDFVGSLVHALRVVVEDEPADGGIRIGRLGGVGSLGNGQLRRGSGGDVQLEVEILPSRIGRIAVDGGVPAAHVIIRLAGKIVHPAVFLVVGRIVREDIVVAVLRIAVLGFDEPFVLVAGVVQHVVEIDGDVLLPGLIDQFLELGLGLGRRSVPAAVFRVDREIVRDVVGVVGLRFLHGAEPEARRAEGVDIVEMVDDALEVAPAVAVAVRERVDVDLVGQARFLGGTGEVRVVFAA